MRIAQGALPSACALVLALAVSACSASTSVPAPDPTSPGGASATLTDAETIIRERCTVCHTSERIVPSRHDRPGWESTVDRMIGKGAKLSAAERVTLIDYLAKS
jgi:cytochrome c5